MEGWREVWGGARVFTFNESCDWPTSSKTRLFHIARIIRTSYYRKQFVRARTERVVIFWHFKEQGCVIFLLLLLSIFWVCSSFSNTPKKKKKKKKKRERKINVKASRVCLHSPWRCHENRLKAGGDYKRCTCKKKKKKRKIKPAFLTCFRSKAARGGKRPQLQLVKNFPDGSFRLHTGTGPLWSLSPAAAAAAAAPLR